MFFQPPGARIGMREHGERTRQHSVGPIKAAVKDKATGRPPEIFKASFFLCMVKMRIAGYLYNPMIFQVKYRMNRFFIFTIFRGLITI
jgi:hypothetical protein